MQIKIIKGTYRLNGQETNMSGLIFPLIKEYSQGTNGGYVVVDASHTPGFPNRNIKIKIESINDYRIMNNTGTQMKEESDIEIMNRMREKFSILEQMTQAAKKGLVKALIVSGPPGVGKSHGVEKVLSKYDVLHELSGGDSRFKKYSVIKGALSPIGLYCKLFQFSERDNVLVFDDCDSVFDEPLSLNILKAALDSKKTRRIHWNTDSRILRQEGIPDSFDFKGSVIFITNVKFDHIKSKKLKDHIEALESRCHYIDLEISTEREKMLRIKQVITDGMLDEYKFDENTFNDILDFVDSNKSRLRELSLRTVIKTADLVKAFPNNWENIASITLLKG